MTDELGYVIVMTAIFIILLIGITLAVGYEVQHFAQILRKGAKMEFTKFGGLISLITFLVVAAIVSGILLVSKVKGFFALALNYQIPGDESLEIIGIFSVVVAMLFNFIFLGIIYWRSETKNSN